MKKILLITLFTLIFLFPLHVNAETVTHIIVYPCEDGSGLCMQEVEEIGK